MHGFYGTFMHTLDPKNRVFVPAKLRNDLGDTFFITRKLSKKALARNLDDVNPDPNYRGLEEELLKRINELGIGPQGFGGDTTALAVKVEHYPTHIAGLPVAVNICCHVARHLTAVI